MNREILRRGVVGLILAAVASAGSAAMDGADREKPLPRTAPPACDFESADGHEFQFSSADSILQPYGYVLFKTAPALLREPLNYAEYSGRRAKLTRRSIVRDGIRWFEGLLDDCTPLYAEDASGGSARDGLNHLAFFGKVVFEQWHREAEQLIGQDVVVRQAGLEPGQQLYSWDEHRSYALRDGEVLTVIGIDTHRYAHAKGVGPFFLRVINEDDEAGLIKYNPRYLHLPEGDLALSRLGASQPQVADRAATPAMELAARTGQRRRPSPRSYVLTVSHFMDEQAGLVAERKLAQGGYNARLLSYDEPDGSVIYKLQIAGLASAEMASEMARQLATRFEWIGAMGRLSN